MVAATVEGAGANQATWAAARWQLARFAWLLLLPLGLQAQPPAPPLDTADRQAQVWATTCMACHGTGGRASGVGRPLDSLTAPEMNTRMLAIRKGDVPATVMRQHLLGYSEPELQRIALALARWPKAPR